MLSWIQTRSRRLLLSCATGAAMPPVTWQGYPGCSFRRITASSVSCAAAEWISAAEGPRFAQIMRQLEEMRQKVTPEEIAHARKVLAEQRLKAKKEPATEDELGDTAKV